MFQPAFRPVFHATYTWQITSLRQKESLDVSNAKKFRTNGTIAPRNKLLLQKRTVMQVVTFFMFLFWF